MGNEQSGRFNDYKDMEIQQYVQKYKKMEETISTNNQTIQVLLNENVKLQTEIKELKDESEKKEEDMKRRVTDMKTSKKKVHSELTKYKSVPEVQQILDLYSNLMEFRGKLDAVKDENFGLSQLNNQDAGIEKLKQNNLALSRKLKDNGMKAVLKEKAAELKQAEDELNAKKEIMKKSFMQNNDKLVVIQEKMKGSTNKFAATMGSAIGEVRKLLEGFKKEFAAIQDANSKVSDLVPYEKVKNILLEQENALLKETILSSDAGPSSFTQPRPQQVFNNLGNPYMKKLSTSRTNLFDNGDVKFTKFSSSDEDDSYSVIGDDNISECDSITGKLKPFKLILRNVQSRNRDLDDVRQILACLTDISYDDIHVKRFGKAGMHPQPIMLFLSSMKYVNDILKNKTNLNQTRFQHVRIHAYKPAGINQNNRPPQENRPNNKKGYQANLKSNKPNNQSKGNNDYPNNKPKKGDPFDFLDR